jgi:hypothetical protein
MANNSEIVIYQGKDEAPRVSVRFEDDNIWLTQGQLAELYGTSRENVTMHIKNVFDDKELDEISTCKKFLQVQTEGKRQVKREIDHYNLDMIISLGYRINSKTATAFRVWATTRLHEYIEKGFTMDDDRLKQGGNRYFRELLQRIRDIRSSERNLYQQVTDIYATSIDYKKDSTLTKQFFATVQNKIHYAVHHHTAAEVVFGRVNHKKAMLGMTNFKGDYITKDDIIIAKNYLDEDELNRLNLIVSMYLDFAEYQAAKHIPMRMADWNDKLNQFLTMNGDKLLAANGKISHEQAKQKAETEYDKYRKSELADYENDYERAIKTLAAKAKENELDSGSSPE